MKPRAAKRCFRACSYGFVEDQFAAEKLRDQLRGQIIRGGSETAGADDQIAQLAGLTKSPKQLFAIVADFEDRGDFHAQQKTAGPR